MKKEKAILVDSNRLKGNYAEYLVAQWLSRMCLVRPVAAGTDIGIDLYCESVIDDRPFLHFWVQVKAIPESNVQNEKEASCEFLTKHLSYWENQPIPVYAFLVPIGGWPPPVPTQRIFGVRITEYILEHGIPEEQTTVTLRTTNTVDADKIDEDLKQFVSGIVPYDSFILLLRRGIIPPIPQLEEPRADQQRYPWSDIYTKHAAKLLDSMMNVSAFAGFASLKAETLGEFQMLKMRKQFEAIVSVFDDDNLQGIALSFLVFAALADGNSSRARNIVAKACDRIREDPALDANTKQTQVKKLQDWLTDVEKNAILKLPI